MRIMTIHEADGKSFDRPHTATMYKSLFKILGGRHFELLLRKGDYTDTFDRFWFQFRQHLIIGGIFIDNQQDGVSIDCELDSLLKATILLDKHYILREAFRETISPYKFGAGQKKVSVI